MKRPPETIENPYRHSVSDAGRPALLGEVAELAGGQEKKNLDQRHDNIVGFKYGGLLPLSLSVCSPTFNKHPTDDNRSSGKHHRAGSPTNRLFGVFFEIKL